MTDELFDLDAIAAMLDAPAAPQPGAGRVARVMLPMPVPEPFDYTVPEDLELSPGDHVSVPLSGKLTRGIVWQVIDNPGGRSLKVVEARLPAPGLPAIAREFVDWVARYTVSPPGMVLRMALRGASPWKPAPTETVYAPVAGVDWRTEPPRGVRLTPQRMRILEEAQREVRTAPALAKATGVGAGVVKTLAEAGLLRAIMREADPPFLDPDPDGPPDALRHTLTDDQERAAGEMIMRLAAGGFQAMLLDGVTGSGKTEVYLEAIAEALRSDPGAQVLVLLPEIALTQAILARFRDRFGVDPVEWHSGISDAARRRAWRGVAEGRARLVVGARSALFLPFPHLRLIVVDEEHDHSYKQDDGVLYQARDMAVVRARLGEAAIVLASATPSIETLANAQRGRYAHLVLPGRPGVATLPDISTIDIRQHRPEKDQWITAPLAQAIEDTIARGEQALLFLNRRGYAPLVICRACGQKMKAPDTDTWLVEHRYTGRLVCHLTGFSIPKPKRCPHCQAEDSLHAVGPGVERLEEEARARFPSARIDVFSSDTAQDPAAVRAKVAAMAAGEIDLLVGTQIVAKGHNFPGLTLVGVVDADLGLRGGDLRAAEKTYQTLVQVAGRAGRADRPGRALLQTVMPDHEALEALVRGDRDGFLAAEIDERRALGLPPFGRMAALTLSGPDVERLELVAREFARQAPNVTGVDVMGPAEPPIAVIRGKWRRRFLVRADLSVDISAFMRAWRERTPCPSSVRATIDIEPYSFM